MRSQDFLLPCVQDHAGHAVSVDNHSVDTYIIQCCVYDSLVQFVSRLMAAFILRTTLDSCGAMATTLSLVTSCL